MGNGLVIAAITAVLKDLLETGLVKSAAMSTLGDVAVTALPLDRVSGGSEERIQLNLFLYQITQNRNADWIARERGRNAVNYTDAAKKNLVPPLALNLHYLLTAHGSKDFQIEMLLGYVIELFQATPVLTREEVQTALKHLTIVNSSSLFAQAYSTLKIDLTEQLNQIRISPTFFSSEEISRLWSVMQSPYRPSIAYEVSTVLIENTELC
ncbi:DUF4255 domain-containing protein [Pseudanabaenaceae cyanobacterium LEGE 13415]|nr:DUF4255 domain-containing protein [Pseudanabaenaceae cyanobacterium LEGE 13415]